MYVKYWKTFALRISYWDRWAVLAQVVQFKDDFLVYTDLDVCYFDPGKCRGIFTCFLLKLALETFNRRVLTDSIPSENQYSSELHPTQRSAEQ